MDLKVNLRLLVVKAHYFFFFGAWACVMPFLPAYISKLGVNSRDSYIIYLCMPLATMVTKPIFGNLADNKQWHKTVMLVSLVFFIASNFGIGCVPNFNHVSNRLSLSSNSSLFCEHDEEKGKNVAFSVCHDEIDNCINEKETQFECTFSCKGNYCASSNASNYVNNSGENVVSCGENSKISVHLASVLNDTVKNVNGRCFALSLPENTSSSSSSSSLFNCSYFSKCKIDDCRCDLPPKQTNLLYYSLLVCFMMIQAISSGIAINLSDNIAYHMCVDENSDFGYQRLWAAAGWAIFALLTSHVIDFSGLEHKIAGGVRPIFLIFLVLSIIDLLISFQLRVGLLPKPQHMWRKMSGVFSKPMVLVTTSAVFAIGLLTGPLWFFQYIFVTELGGQSLLFGLMIAVQCFVGEIPFFLLSGHLIKRTGHVHAFTICLIAFSFRFVCYSLIENPWFFLPLEISNGLCFGYFYVALVSFSNSAAPVGLTATMQGVEQSVFEGIGIAIGYLVGGVLYDAIGGKFMYMSLGLGAVVFSLFFEGTVFFIKRLTPSKEAQEINMELKEGKVILNDKPIQINEE